MASLTLVSFPSFLRICGISWSVIHGKLEWDYGCYGVIGWWEAVSREELIKFVYLFYISPFSINKDIHTMFHTSVAFWFQSAWGILEVSEVTSKTLQWTYILTRLYILNCISSKSVSVTCKRTASSNVMFSPHIKQDHCVNNCITSICIFNISP